MDNLKPTDRKERDRPKRLLIALNDLSESKDYIEAYVAFANTPAYLEAYGALGMDMARRMENALLSYGLISYARPFVQSRGGGWTKVPSRFTAEFTKEERQIHNYVLEARQKLIAHSDLDGVHTDSIETDNNDVILSVRPVPIVMIRGEKDSLSIHLAAERSNAPAQTTIAQFRQLVEEVKPSESKFNILLSEHRLFDIDIGICAQIVTMINKVYDAIRVELGPQGVEE